MSYNYRVPNLEFKKVTFNSSNYLYIHIEDLNNKEKEDQISWVYIEIKNFWLKKDSKVLSIGNHLGIVYNLTGYTESMINDWYNQIKKTIGFP